MREQRRGRRIAMSAEELDAFLGEERTCRVASVGADGLPHNTPLWFVWDGKALWLNSIVKSQRWTDISRNSYVSIIVDAGHDFGELRGAELIGRMEQVGDVPRSIRPGPATRRTRAHVRRQVRRRRVPSRRAARLAAAATGEGSQLGLPQDGLTGSTASRARYPSA